MTVLWPPHWAADEGWPRITSREPLANDRRGWSALNDSLSGHYGQRIAERAEGLGGPPSKLIRSRTIEEADRVIAAFYEKHRRRPQRPDDNFSAWDQWLSEHHGTTLRKRCDELGLPPARTFGRTQDSADAEIQAFFQKHGRRPQHREMNQVHLWHAARGSSLTQRCDELGLPALYVDRSTESIKARVLAYFEQTGKRPTCADKVFSRDSRTLRLRGLGNLPDLCDELGLPRTRTAPLKRPRGEDEIKKRFDTVRAEIKAFFEAHGHRPFETSGSSWKTHSHWLRTQGTTLSKLCLELGVPCPRNYERTVEGVREEIRAYFDAHGKRPSGNGDDRAWCTTDKWLRCRGESLAKLCEEMGLPGRRRPGFISSAAAA